MKYTEIWVIKNNYWIWIAVNRLGKRFIHFVTGTRGVKTGKKLWDGIENTESMKQIATDHRKPYESFIPPDKHIQSKAETFTAEGYNSLFRHFLAKLRRKSKCDSQSETMRRYSIKLFITKWNGELRSILN